MGKYSCIMQVMAMAENDDRASDGAGRELLEQVLQVYNVPEVAFTRISSEGKRATSGSLT